MLSANMTSMATCHGEHKGCEPLAKNILAVAAEIEESCAVKYFDSSAFQQCEAEIAAPLCESTAREFPKMCPFFFTGPTVEGGYIGGDDASNTHGEWCKACEQIAGAGGSGCFASSSLVTARGRGIVPLSVVDETDEIESVSLSGGKMWSRVLYAYTHPADGQTVRVSWGAAGGHQGSLEVTGWHPMPVTTAVCGARYCSKARVVAAGSLRAGDKLYLAGGFEATVAHMERGAASVRYVVTSNSMMVVDGVSLASPRHPRNQPPPSWEPLNSSPRGYHLQIRKFIPHVHDFPPPPHAPSHLPPPPPLLLPPPPSFPPSLPP